MKNEFVHWRSHRILRKLANYREFTKDEIVPKSISSKVPLQNEETIIGIYQNSPEEEKDSIVITNFGLYILTSEPAGLIEYGQLKSTNVFEEESSESLIVLLKNERKYSIPIKGGSGKFRDKFEFSHFLDRVISDFRKDR